MIVDPDSKADRDLSPLLIDEGYDVETSEGIRKAAERVKDVKFDCVIMDVDLPEMKGYEAVPIIKAIDPKVQIIMTTAENTMELEAEVRKQDIFFYYIKSFDPEELKEAVQDVFKKLGKVKKVKEISKSQKVLVIDDDPSFITAMTPVLESRGCRVEAAYSKSEAPQIIERFKPDLIVLDIMMETMFDGFDLCRELKRDPELKEIPILAVSAINNVIGLKFSPKTDGEYFPADDFMEKPVSPENLLERVEKLLKV